jgi:16S rRNA (guanine527-N7)-methyltransferase
LGVFFGAPPGTYVTGEAHVNPITGAPSPPAPAGPATATAPFHSTTHWSGLFAEAERIGVPLDNESVARFARYRDLLLARNAQVNLTAIRDPEGIERRLFFDSLAILPAIDTFLESRPKRNGRWQLIDVGSGGGFPGLALKIAKPDLDVTLVEATGKKVAFLDEVIADLGLDAVRAIHGRAEALGHDPRFRERFDMATARAVASLPTLLELVVPFLDVGGQAFFPKGLAIEDELAAGRRAARLLGAEIVAAGRSPTGDSRLVIVRKTTLTPKTYPRRAGVPSRTPLGEQG